MWICLTTIVIQVSDVHTNGVRHSRDELDDCIVSFDLCSDIFFRTPLPSHVHDNFGFLSVDRQFVALNESIAFILSKSDIFFRTPLPSYCVDNPIRAENKDDIFFTSTNGELVRFDLSTQMIEKYCINDVLVITILLRKEVLLPVGGI